MRLAAMGIAAMIAAAVPGLGEARQPAPAATGVMTKVTAAHLIDILKGEGYAASLDPDGDVLWKLEGFKSHIIVAKDTESIQFHSSFSDGNATLKKVNDWNWTKRFSRSYLDEEGDPHLELDLELSGGVTQERIVDFLKTCRVSFVTWCKEVVE